MKTFASRPTSRRARALLCSALLLPIILQVSSARAEHDARGPRPQVATPSAAASNDNFSTPQALTGSSGSATGSNVGASKQAGEPDHAGDYGGASVWYTWTPSTTEVALFSTAGSDFDTLLAVYTGANVASLTEVASNDDYSSLNSQVTFVATAGRTYHIAVDGFGGDTGNIFLTFSTNSNTTTPLITSSSRATAQVNRAFTYQITATNNPTSYSANGLPTGLSVNTRTGVISGTPTTLGKFTAVVGATSANGTGQAGLTITVSSTATHPAFFAAESPLGNGAYYLSFATGNYFGYYSYLSDSHYIYHYDLGYEYVFDAQDSSNGVYFYDFKSRGFFYTSPTFPFPYMYDFSQRSTVYYYPDNNPNNPGHYNTNGVRYFYVFSSGQIISK